MQGSKHLPRKYLDAPNLPISNTKHKEVLLIRLVSGDFLLSTMVTHHFSPPFGE